MRCNVVRKHGLETVWIDRTGPRMIHGIASTPTRNTKNTVVLSRGCHVRFPVPLKFGHKEGAIGEITLVRRSDQQVYVQGVLDDTEAADYAWRLIERAELSALSVGLTNCHTQAVVDGVTFIDRWTLVEVSILRRGANPDATFEVKYASCMGCMHRPIASKRHAGALHLPVDQRVWLCRL